MAKGYWIHTDCVTQGWLVLSINKRPNSYYMFHLAHETIAGKRQNLS